jgi:hypothetical protein
MTKPAPKVRNWMRYGHSIVEKRFAFHDGSQSVRNVQSTKDRDDRNRIGRAENCAGKHGGSHGNMHENKCPSDDRGGNHDSGAGEHNDSKALSHDGAIMQIPSCLKKQRG